MDFISMYKGHDGIKLLSSRYTNRGLMPCPLCGFLNGNRSKGCKNKLCTLTAKNKKSTNTAAVPIKLDTVQIISTALDSKLFSVQIRDRDMEHRSFVQIIEKSLSIDEKTNINAICFVDACKKNLNTNRCQHVVNSLDNIVQAVPLDVNISIWHQMNISEETKTRLWKIYSETQLITPIIQRINKTTFVIKCDISDKFSIGLLHVTLDGGSNVHPSFSCACKRLKIVMSPNNFTLLDSDKCDHLFILIAAILSNENLKDEFKQHIELLSDMYHTSNESMLEENFLITEDFIKFSENILNDMELSNGYLDCIFNDTISSNLTNIDTENHFNSLEKNDSYQNSNTFQQSTDQQHTYSNIASDVLLNNNNSAKLNQPMCNIALNNHLMVENGYASNEIIQNKITTKRKRQTKLLQMNNNDVDDPSVTIKTVLNLMAFENWLSSVIEQINLTMDYNNKGQPDKLIFSISKEFFQILHNRFSTKKNKIRVPNLVQTIPYGTKNLTMYTWSFFDLATVQRIFSTKNIKLETERKFTEVFENYYEYCDGKTKESAEYLTFFKIKSIDEKKFANDYFTIEWIPDVLPVSSYGELRIQFVYGFKKNNQIVEK